MTKPARLIDIAPPREYYGKNNRYHVKECIGKGAFAQVYKCVDRLHPHRRMAIKILVFKPGQTESQKDALRARLYDESEILRYLTESRTPHVPHRIDYFPEALVMTRISGHSLKYHAKGPAETESQTRERLVYLISVAEALMGAHDLGFVHRDVKPDNIVVRRGAGHLVDWGCAQGAKKPGSLAGTWGYWAPEVLARTHQHSFESDIYSLGASAYELIVGRTPIPFPDLPAEQQIEFALRSSIQAPREVNPCVGGRISNLVMNCLEPIPFARPTAEEFVSELERLLD